MKIHCLNLILTRTLENCEDYIFSMLQQTLQNFTYKERRRSDLKPQINTTTYNIELFQ